MLHRKNSVARKIQDYLMSMDYLDPDAWMWFPIPNNPDFCVAIEWQGGYDGENFYKQYGEFGQEENGEYYVVNVSIKMTREFSINGEYALYAEYYFAENEDDDLFGSCSLDVTDIKDKFYSISRFLAKQFNWMNKMNPKRK